jgi:hypothetical protein
MRKSTLIVALAAALVFIGTGCDTLVTLDKPNVSTEAVSTGATLRLTWTAITDAKSYKITTDDSIYTTTSTSFDVASPTSEIKVVAVNGNDESDPATIDCKVVETATFEVYGISDPDTTHRSAFGFNADGSMTSYSITQANYAAMDFYADDVNFTVMTLVNPGDQSWNAKGNATAVSASTVYDDCNLAPAPGTYDTQQSIENGGVYFLWLDRTNNSWDATDNYAKAKVVSIQGPLVTLKVGYQKIAGLRWLVN